MTDWNSEGGNLIFLLSLPRAGSTMLQMMLSAHSRVAGSPEPHVMVPLYFAGYEAQLRTADYDAINAALGFREFIERLPGGEATYLQACRAYAGTLYAEAMRSKPAARFFIDKTPPNVRVWRFLVRVFPRAQYVVLLRHPLAVLDSYAQTFFMGDYELSQREDPLLSAYLPAMAAFLREAAVTHHVIRYEDLVASPHAVMRRLLTALDLEYEPAVVEYGSVTQAAGTMGDPVAAKQAARPTEASRQRWAAELRADAGKLAAARRIVAELDPTDLATCGYPVEQLFDPVEGAGPVRPRRRTFYHLQRRAYFALRGVVRRLKLRGLLTKVRYYCDLLLRQ